MSGEGSASTFIDFENAVPSASEESLYNQTAKFLEESKAVYQRVEDYKGCASLTQKAMSQPSQESELNAFEGLLLAVDDIQLFFNFSKSLETLFQNLVTTIANGAKNEEKQGIGAQQALSKQVAQIFDFALRFDGTRMARPNMSNDFSYYRRLLGKFNKHPNIKVNHDEASGLCLFIAEPLPMMGSLSKSAARALEYNNGGVTEVLSCMANSCMSMMRSKRFTSPETIMLCARAMTGSIVLYDLVDVNGVFHKKSPVYVKTCILTLQKELEPEHAQPLLNAIHFSTKHFNDAPDVIQNLFD